MPTARVLVVDADPWTQRMVSAVLAQGGHRVELASDGWEALIRANRAMPDLVITEIKLPTTDGWALMESLRSRSQSADVSAIFLTTLSPERAPGPGFRTGTDEIVPKPFRLEQLAATVQTVLSRRFGHPLPTPPPLQKQETIRISSTLRAGGAEAESSRQGVLTGWLEHFGLSSMLILLELERKSGVLLLAGSQGSGRIFFREGRVLRAQIDGSDCHHGASAVYELLTWSSGRFEFNASEIDGEDEVGSSTSFLLLEGARLQDEHKHDRNEKN